MLQHKSPLNNNDFLLQNQIKETTTILSLSYPYNITILILDDTKINISKSNDSNYVSLFNSFANEGEIFQFNFESIINFEFLDNADIRVKLNEYPIDNLLLNDGLSIRGSYEIAKSQLYLGFYKKN